MAAPLFNMNDPILFDRNDDLGIVRMWSYDSDTDEVTIQTIQDVDEIIEANRAEFNEHTSLDRWGELKRVASIPMSLYAQLKRSGLAYDEKAMRRWLNDPDNRHFRTRPGVV